MWAWCVVPPWRFQRAQHYRYYGVSAARLSNHVSESASFAEAQGKGGVEIGEAGGLAGASIFEKFQEGCAFNGEGEAGGGGGEDAALDAGGEFEGAVEAGAVGGEGELAVERAERDHRGCA